MSRNNLLFVLLIAVLSAALTLGVFLNYAPGKQLTRQTTATENYEHHIGQLAQGGIIFYLWKDTAGQEHGLVASLADIDKPQATEKIGRNLLGLQPEFPVTGLLQESSPGQCNFYPAGGYFDWYLPQAWEMFELFNQGLIINNILNTDDNESTYGLTFFSSHYWTMPTATSGNAWDQCYFSDFGTGYSKDYVGKVRAVRRF